MPARPRRQGPRHLRLDEKVIPLSQGPRLLQPGERLEGEMPASRTGIIPEDVRQATRNFVENQSFFARFGIEMAPATFGTVAGGGLGALLGGFGALPGAVAGGLLFEFIAQETGVTEQSDIMLGASALGPVAGRVAGGAVRLTGRGVGKAITSIAPAKAALARKAVKEAADELSSIGAKILSKQKGIMRVKATKIYEAVRELGVQIDPRHSFTTKAIANLEKEMLSFEAFPEVAQALKVLNKVKGIMSQEAISFSDIIAARRFIGIAIAKAERGGGVKLGTSKSLFKAMADDVDELAARGSGLKGAGAQLLNKAVARAKLEFSIGELESGVARNLKFISQEEDVILNVNGLRNWLRRVSDPSHPQFKKNFTVALKDEIPDMMKQLAILDKIAATLSPAGPGNIVLRGIGAKAGRNIFGVAGPLGEVIGALGGASMPEMVTGILSTKVGLAVLTNAAKMGRGIVAKNTWQVLGQIMAQQARTGESQGEPIPFRSTVPIQ